MSKGKKKRNSGQQHRNAWGGVWGQGFLRREAHCEVPSVGNGFFRTFKGYTMYNSVLNR